MNSKKDIESLLANSSLGTKAARRLRERTSGAVIDKILDYSRDARGISRSNHIGTNDSLTIEKGVSMSIEVKCIKKSDRQSSHDRITHIGGLNPDGGRWKLSQADAIAGIKDGKWSFYVSRPPGHTTKVIVATSASGREYLKTTSDGEQPNNLLSLPECP